MLNLTLCMRAHWVITCSHLAKLYHRLLPVIVLLGDLGHGRVKCAPSQLISATVGLVFTLFQLGKDTASDNGCASVCEVYMSMNAMNSRFTEVQII